MKIKNFAIGVVLAVSTMAGARQTAQSAPSAQPLPEAQHDKVMLAIKDYQLAQANQRLLQQAKADSDKELQDAQAAIEAAVAKARRDLKLGDDWTFDYQNLQFTKTPAKK